MPLGCTSKAEDSRYYLHEAVDENGNLLYAKEEGTMLPSDTAAEDPRERVANTEPSVNSISQVGGNSQGAVSAIERMAATVGSEGAKVLREFYTEAEGDEISYIERVLPLYNAGKAGKIVNVDALSRAEQAMYNAGLIDAKVEAARAAKTPAKTKTPSVPSAKTSEYKADMTVPRGKVKVDKDVKMSRAQVRQLEALAKNTNTAVTVGGYAPVDENGNQKRGWYVEEDGHIHVYADAKVVVHTKNGARTLEGGSAAVMVVAGHEFTHRLKTLNAEGYKRFANFALDKMGDYTESLAREKGWSRPKAEEEAVCDFAMQFVFSDEKTVREITRTDSKLAALVREIIEKIREVLHLNKGAENDAVLQLMDEAAELWKSVYDEAVENVKNGVAETKNTAESGVKNSESGADADMVEAVSKNEKASVLKSFAMAKLNDTKYTQDSVLSQLSQENFFTDSATASREDMNAGSGMVIETNQRSIKEAFSYKNFTVLPQTLKILKLAVTRDIPALLANGDILFDNIGSIYGENNPNLNFAYILGETNILGRHVFVLLSIKKSPVKNKLYDFDVFETKDAARRAAIKKVDTAAAMTHGIDKTVAQKKQKVKGKKKKRKAIAKNQFKRSSRSHSTSGNDADLLASVYEAREVWKRAKKMTPMRIANMQLSDVDPLPKVEPRKPSGVNAENGKESKFYGSAMRSDNVFDETRDLIESMDDVRYYYGVSNEETLNEANDRLNLKGQTENNRFFALNPESATAVDVAEGFILLKRYQDKGDFETAAI